MGRIWPWGCSLLTAALTEREARQTNSWHYQSLQPKPLEYVYGMYSDYTRPPIKLLRRVRILSNIEQGSTCEAWSPQRATRKGFQEGVNSHGEKEEDLSLATAHGHPPGTNKTFPGTRGRTPVWNSPQHRVGGRKGGWCVQETLAECG